jgi:signal peptidase II
MPLASRSSIKPPDTAETLAPEARVRWDLIVGAVALGVIIIDQITKHLIVAHFTGTHAYDVVPVFGNVLSLEYTGNRGAAFSSFTNSPGVLAFLIAVAVGVIGWMYWSTRPRKNPWLKVTFGLIIGGALGNLIDRMRLGYVVDFIHFQIPAIHFDFAIFNVADSAISVGVVLLAIIFWTLPRESDPTLATAADGNPDTGKAALHATPAKVGATADLLAKTSSATKGAITSTTTTKTPIAPVKAPNGMAPKAATTKAPAGASVPRPITTGAAKPAPRATTNRPSSKSKRKRH